MKIDFNRKIYDLVSGNKDILEFLSANGFENLRDKEMLENFGRKISLKDALKLKNINSDIFRENLEVFMENKNEFKSEDSDFRGYINGKDVAIEGVLPCPIRMPLVDAVDDYINSCERDFNIFHFLNPASNGIEDIKKKLSSDNIEKYPDIITSAGFEFFFSNRVRNLMENGIYSTNLFEINNEFEAKGIDLKDPKGNYQILGVVPAVFIVNKKLLGNINMPRFWKDILSSEFENKVSIPFMDLDLFNAIVLSIYAKYGIDGINNLKRSFYRNLHPAQMIKTNGNQAIVSIAPYFFTTMIKDENLEVIWPEDGAIISPIFMITRKNIVNVNQVSEFFNSEKIGSIFSFNGNFPTTNAKIDNNLNSSYKYMWTGWDFIYNNDIEELINEFSEMFSEE